VRSSQASAEYFARLAGLSQVEHEHVDATPDARVERFRWAAPGAPEVMLLAVHGGGHVIPGPRADFPVLLGKVSAALDGPVEAWSFFARQKAQEP
jgi:polyhydroxybutyrate depolymerase